MATHAGVLNISNKLLVALNILLEMREHIKKGEPPANAIITSLLNLPSSPTLTTGERRYLTEKLYDGYFAFEILTDRDWNSAICGICGVCPLFESGDGNVKNCTPLTKEMVRCHLQIVSYIMRDNSLTLILKYNGQLNIKFTPCREKSTLTSGGNI